MQAPAPLRPAKTSSLPPPVLLVGVSARAFAHSAQRAGLSPIAADLFADLDLAERCPTTRIGRYPADFLDVARQTPAHTWCYAGALENYPDLVDRIAQVRPLWGNGGEVLRRVRDPWQLADALAADGFRMPELRLPTPGKFPSGRWLQKRRASAGGLGVEWLEPNAPPQEADVYWQRWVPGRPASALFVAADGCAQLLGASRQLIGSRWAGSGGFRYVGSLAPLALARSEEQQLIRLGESLARRFELVGLFGVDYVRTPHQIWPLEVNPRYTAAVEVIERAYEVHAMAHHVAACRDGQLLTVSRGEPTCCGKAIVFARSAFVVRDELLTLAGTARDVDGWPQIADVPQPGSPVETGHPIVTVLARGKSLAEVAQRLRQLARQVRATAGDRI